MRLTEQFLDVLDPVRDIHVAGLLSSMARALARGSPVDAEPIDRAPNGAIRRSGPLMLPTRHDFAVRATRRTMLRRVEGAPSLRFIPMIAAVTDVMDARIAPFDWGAAAIEARCGATAPDWTALRRWYLEWFQPRFGEESPDLLGVAHGIEGPAPVEGGWRFTVDLGSCSVRGFIAMLTAFGQSGCAEIRVGETEGAI
jgi:hypothetical protein